MKEIKFYKVNDDYGFMSNFAPYPFSDGSKIWPTSEHYFQAQKFLVPLIQEKIRQIVSPMDALMLASFCFHLKKDREQNWT